MKTIETKVYDFSELSEEAKDVARSWYSEASHDDYQIAYDDTVEDAKNIGLEITELSTHKTNKGSFIISAIECSEAILKNHGPDCETYKTAKAFQDKIAALPDTTDENDNSEAMDDLEDDFRNALLEDYRVMYDKDCDFRQTAEYIDENIIANKYTFLESGKHFG